MSVYNSQHTGLQIDACTDTYQNATEVQAIVDAAIAEAIVAAKLAMYPIGSIYITTDFVSPATFIGGTWEQIQDTFLLACGETYTAGDTGGEATHTLTINEMPSHRHATSNYNGGGNSAKHATTNAYPHGDSNYWNYNNPGYSSYTGGGLAHNNMPPYLAVYVWKRVADTSESEEPNPEEEQEGE